ncbi:MAG: hypothetical protein K6B45_04715 [Bacteroidaceae bacterium]|nr:hypothetical protein [Bacteroidaceae bacterium]
MVNKRNRAQLEVAPSKFYVISGHQDWPETFYMVFFSEKEANEAAEAEADNNCWCYVATSLPKSNKPYHEICA